MIGRWKAGGFAVYDLHGGTDAPRSARELPGLVAAAVRIMWGAARREALAVAILQLVSGLGLGLGVVLGARVLNGLLLADQGDDGAEAFLGSAAALAAVTAVLGFAAALRREQEELYAELFALQAAAYVDQAMTDDAPRFVAPLRWRPPSGSS